MFHNDIVYIAIYKSVSCRLTFTCSSIVIEFLISLRGLDSVCMNNIVIIVNETQYDVRVNVLL